MIGSLRGLLLEKNPPELLIEVQGGVGYKVFASMHTFYLLPDVGQEVKLYIEMIVREDAQVLYGFHQKRERLLFQELLKVSGIGPKTAIGILSKLDVDSCVQYILNHQLAELMSVPGVGRKTAERLIVEMKDRLARLPFQSDEGISASPVSPKNEELIREDSMNALIALGYKPQEATRVITQVAEPGLTREEFIRRALKHMMKNH